MTDDEHKRFEAEAARQLGAEAAEAARRLQDERRMMNNIPWSGSLREAEERLAKDVAALQNPPQVVNEIVKTLRDIVDIQRQATRDLVDIKARLDRLEARSRE